MKALKALFGADAGATDAPWLDALDEPAALVSREGALLAANAPWRAAFGAAAPDVALEAAGLEAQDVHALAAAARKGAALTLERAFGRAQVSPLGAAGLWRIARPTPEAASLVQTVAEALSRPAVAPAAPAPGPAIAVATDGLATALPFARLDPADPGARAARGNAAFLKAFGDEAAVAPFLSLFAEADRAELAAALRAAPAPTVEAASARDPAQSFEVAFGRDAEGPVAFLFDVSARAAVEQSNAQRAKLAAIGQIAGGVAHELNNVLNIVILNGEKLLTRHPAGDPDYFHLQQIGQNATRASELVKSLLAYSRKQTLRRQPIDLPHLIADLEVLLRQLTDDQVKIGFQHQRDLPVIRADKQQLETVVINLVTNARDAIRATGAPGRITVATKRAARADVLAALRATPGLAESAPDCPYAAIAVSDTGTGIDKDKIDKIFEPFFTTKEQGKGTGLGLAMIYGFVKQSGGFIALDTQTGRGSTFTIFLPETAVLDDEDPAEEQAAAPPAPAAGAETPVSDFSGRGRILLVDDEDGLRSIVSSLLSERGYEVVEACDGEEALAILEDETEPFHLMISDVIMPGMDGPSLLKAAQPYLKNTRVVFVSGYAEKDFSRTLDSQTHVSFLPKPFTLPELAERVKQELRAA
jgi:two-component system cell cycle sensor histidine kinase/response regulator CckA